jgi:hypothetical protein
MRKRRWLKKETIVRGRRARRTRRGVNRCDHAAGMQQQDEGAPDKPSLGHQCAMKTQEHIG